MNDQSLREALREALENYLEVLSCGGDVEKKMEYKRRFITKLRSSPIAILTEKANEQHYEVPTKLFQLMLGYRMKYSSGFYPSGVDSLNAAEDAMLDLVCKRCELTDGMKVMDLGCGWGSTALWILEKYKNCLVTCVSNSRTQKKYIESRAKAEGYSSRITCITADANHFDTEEKYDRVISIEMFEHMKNYDNLLRKISTWLKHGGMLFTQILCHREFTYPFSVKEEGNSDWMAENFFSGGTMPSSDLFLYFQKDLVIRDHWNLSGTHYSKTLEAWLEKLDASREEALDVLAYTYGSGKAEQELFNWRKFFIYCSESFNMRNGNEWIVAHHLFSKRPGSKL